MDWLWWVAGYLLVGFLVHWSIHKKGSKIPILLSVLTWPFLLCVVFAVSFIVARERLKRGGRN